MFSGVPGLGAEECAYLTALDLEIKRAAKKHVTLGSIDVFKCFDQILRPLVYRLAEVGGMPREVLHAYRSFVEAMRV
eukprot:10798171-Karenia_brevis.AAC.1